MKYKILEEHSIKALEYEVKNLIDKGWTPLGGVSCSNGNMDYYSSYVQAMVKEDESCQKKM